MSKKQKRQKQPQQNPAPLRRPDTNEIAVAQVTDKYSEYPSNGLTPVKLAEIFKEADAGDVLRQMELFEEMEEKDPHLFSQLQTRKNAVTGLDFEIIPFSDDPRDKEIADFIEEQINGIESLEDVETDLLDAIGKGFAVSKSCGATTRDTSLSGRLSPGIKSGSSGTAWTTPSRYAPRTQPRASCSPRINSSSTGTRPAADTHPGRASSGSWPGCTCSKTTISRTGSALPRSTAYRFAWASMRPGASEADKVALMQALIQIGADAAGIIPDGTSIDFITTEKTSSSDLYERLARYCDEQISKAILGQTLTSDSGGGSYAQSKTHNDVRHDLTVADCKSLASTLRRDLIRPLCIFNFGEDKRVPHIRFDCEESEDLTQTATIIGTLVNEVGLRVPTSFIYKKFSIPEPEADEEVAAPRSTSAGLTGLPFKKEQNPAQIALKAEGDDGIGTQQHIDKLASAAVRHGAGSFKRAFGPVLKIIEKAESLEELRDMMEDDKAVAELYAAMDVSEVEELLQRSCSTQTSRGGCWRMADIDEIFTRKDMTFEEAVSYFKERVPVTAAKFYAIAEEYRGSPSRSAATPRPRCSSGSMMSFLQPWRKETPSQSFGRT